jgi:hypothetical protein
VHPWAVGNGRGGCLRCRRVSGGRVAGNEKHQAQGGKDLFHSYRDETQLSFAFAPNPTRQVAKGTNDSLSGACAERDTADVNGGTANGRGLRTQ